MRKKLILLIVLLSITFMYAFFALDGGRKNVQLDAVKETGQSRELYNKVPMHYESNSVIDISGAITGMTNYYDYRTNGQNPHGLYLLGDTVLVAADLVDSLNASTSTARKSYYQVSTNGGATWMSDPILVSTSGNAYPDIDPIILSGSRSIATSGRQFVAGVRTGYVAPDVILGAGSLTSYLLNGQENFTQPLSATTIAGGFESKTTDTLYFVKFDAVTNTYSGKLPLAVTADGIVANSRSYTAANTNGRVAIAWWDPAAGDMWVRVSTDGGATFGAKQHAVSGTQMLAGTSCQSWLAADITFSPTNNVCIANCTLESGALGTARGTKIVFWSPTINSGNPVIIVDYANAPSNAMIKDTTYYGNHYSTTFEQVGMTALSHPSLSYSSDGTRLFCVYQVSQKDTTSYGFFFKDLCVSTSTDNGATWGAPVILTNTPTDDEIYPILSRTGNTPTNIAITYQNSGFPGSFSFTNTTTPESKVYNIFRRYNPVTGIQIPIGIVNISNEVPVKFAVSQNYPNPFNPSTKIKFALPKSANVTINVFNVAGQLVKTLANNEFVNAGTKEVTFDGTGFASGVYFYTIKAGEFAETRKMILVK